MYLALYIDHFPAQAVAAYDPVRRGRPFVVVRQSADSHKCAIFACSALARARGIRRGQMVMQVRKRHPDLDVVLRNEAFEQTARDELAWLFERLTPEFDVRPSGRCLLDLSGTPSARQGDFEAGARSLQARITRTIGLSDVACGIAGSRLIAGMLARLSRPDGVRLCLPGEEAAVLASLSADLLPVSSKVRERMQRYGVHQIGQVQRLGKNALVVRLGAAGERLYSLSIGLDAAAPGGVAAPSSGASVNGAPKSEAVEAETVLDRDINDERLLLQHVRYTADKLCHALKTAHAFAGKCTFVLTYTDERTARRTAAFGAPTHALDVVAPAAERLFRALYQRRVAVKSIRLVVNRPRRDTGQLDLFESARDRKRRALSEAVVSVRKRMGFPSVVHGAHFGAASSSGAHRTVTPSAACHERQSKGRGVGHRGDPADAPSGSATPADFLGDDPMRWGP